MKLEQAWILMGSLNDDANEQSNDRWLAGSVAEAIRYQSDCARKKFLDLEETTRQEIIYWVRNDDEFLDYVECILGEDFIKGLL